jgi:CheY-like chemotaxis protein
VQLALEVNASTVLAPDAKTRLLAEIMNHEARTGDAPEPSSRRFASRPGRGRRRLALIRILLADDHALVRAGVRSMLEQMPGVEVVGEACDGHEALRLVAEFKPDLVLLDISMPGLTGLEVVERISRDHRRTRTVILSMHVADVYLRRALQAGAGS